MGLFGSDPYRDAYREQRRALNAAARASAAGKANVDFALRGYDEDFWNTRAQEYANLGLQSLATNYSRSIEATAKALANRGLSSSSIADRAYGTLAEQNALQRNQVAADAWRQAWIRDRGELERRRMQLYGLADQGISPLAAAMEAGSMAKGAYAQPSGLGAAFMGAVQSALPGLFAQLRGFPGLLNLMVF